MDETVLIVVGALVTGLWVTALSLVAGSRLRRHDLKHGISALAKSYPSQVVSPRAHEIRCSVVVTGLLPCVYRIRINCDQVYLYLSPRSLGDHLGVPFRLKGTIAIPLEHVECSEFWSLGLLRKIAIRDDSKELHVELLADVTAEDCSRINGSSKSVSK